MAREDRSGQPPVSTDRVFRLVRLGQRRALDGVKTRWRGRSLDADSKSALQRDYVIRSAEDAATEFGQLKGAAMKLGQLLSYQIDALPEPARRSLASLRADAPPMDPRLAAEVIRADLGASPDALFRRWEPEPVAAASIGQVHRAILDDGTPVALKVQYPGIAESIGSDLRGARWLHRLVSSVAWRNLDVDALVDELRDRLQEEIDYRVEAARQRRFAVRYADHPFIAVPAVIDEYCSDRVLTTGWVDGVGWDDLLSQPDQDRQWAAEAIFRFTQASIYRAREFHGDPHPGNFRFSTPAASGRLTVFDFGLVKALSDADCSALWPIIDPLLAQDRAAVAELAVQAGFLPPDHGLDIDHLWEYLKGPYVPFLTERFTYSPQFTQQTLQRMTDPRGAYLDVMNTVSMPASFTVLDRVVWGLTALLGQLGADNTWRAILAEYRHGAPPATELGRLEAEWAQKRGGWDTILETSPTAPPPNDGPEV